MLKKKMELFCGRSRKSTTKTQSLCTRGLVFALFLVLPFNWGCGAKKEKVNTDVAIRYYLNHQEYDKAALLLRASLNDEPNHYKNRLLLASTYAAELGLDVIQSFELAKRYILEGKGISRSQQNESSATIGIPGEFKSALNFFSDIIRIVDDLPIIDRKNETLLNASILQLNRIPSQANEYNSAQVYASMINILQISNQIRRFASPDCLDQLKIFGPNLTPKSATIVKVTLFVADIQDHLATAIERIEVMGEHRAMPDAKEIRKEAESLREWSRGISTISEIYTPDTWSLGIDVQVCD